MMEKEILIVGAGPTGLTAAILLSQFDIPVRIIDQKFERTSTSNALAVQIRTLEVFDKMGLADRFLSVGEPLQTFNLFSGKERLATFSFSDMPTQYPFVLAIPQSDTEKILGDYLKEKNIVVERGIKLESLVNQGKSISVTLQDSKNNQTEEKIVDWVLACDGAHSTVRALTGEEFTGTRSENHFIMMDCQLKWEEPHDAINAFFDKGGPIGVIPVGKTHTRVIVDVSHDGQLKTKHDPEISDFQRILKERSIPFDFYDVTWISSFWTHHQQIKHYQRGHIFYLGDSAHVHSPVGGQGMNTGIQDAYNLAWKLAQVYQGRAPENTLDTYHQERFPVAQQLLERTQRATKMLTLHNVFLQKIRNFLIKQLTKITTIRKTIKNQISELDIHYQQGMMIQSKLPAKTLKPGSRMPNFVCHLEGGRKRFYQLLNMKKHTVLFANMDINERETDLIDYLELSKTISIAEAVLQENLGVSSKDAWAIIIRPDQYIGAVSMGDDEAIQEYINACFKGGGIFG